MGGKSQRGFPSTGGGSSLPYKREREKKRVTGQSPSLEPGNHQREEY